MARSKKVYDAGDLIEVVRGTFGTPGSLAQIKPDTSGRPIGIERKTRLIVIRHESGGGTPRFAGSVLCMWAQGIVWVDSRRVALVVDAQGQT